MFAQVCLQSSEGVCCLLQDLEPPGCVVQLPPEERGGGPGSRPRGRDADVARVQQEQSQERGRPDFPIREEGGNQL